MAFSTGSYFSRETNDSSRAYARAAADNSYKYYNNITWSFWAALVPSVNRNIFSMWEDVASANRCWLFSTQSDGTFRVIFSWDGTNFSNHKTVSAHLTGEWKHFCITFASGTFYVYINNALQTLTTTTAWTGGAVALHSAGQQVMIGSKNPGTPPIDNSPSGNFNNFSMWSKVLSTDERTELYNSGRPGDLSAHSAVANLTNWWRADQSEAAPTTTLTDAKNGSGSNMTITASGTSGVFGVSGSHAKLEDYPSIANVLTGIEYDGGDKTGTLDIATSVWSAATASYATSATFGEKVGSKLLTADDFVGLK